MKYTHTLSMATLAVITFVLALWDKSIWVYAFDLGAWMIIALMNIWFRDSQNKDKTK